MCSCFDIVIIRTFVRFVNAKAIEKVHKIRTLVLPKICSLFQPVFRTNVLISARTCAKMNPGYQIINEFSHEKEAVMPGKITKKQEEILEFIKSQILAKGYPPSVRDICEAVNLRSTSSVHSHLATLEENGYIHRDPQKPRCIEIVDDSFRVTNREMVNVPVIGTVAAGQPLLAQESIVDYFPIPTEYMPNAETFFLKVKGDSMINVGIFDGDRVLVRRQNTAYNGDTVVALIDDSATVKTFYKENGHIRLQPENDALDPIIVPDCMILGVVIGLFRFYR
jgi:repressor LexA